MSVKETADHTEIADTHSTNLKTEWKADEEIHPSHFDGQRILLKSGCEISKNISQKVLTSLLFGDKINKPCEGDNFSHKMMAL